jgi:hypothetical protein
MKVRHKNKTFSPLSVGRGHRSLKRAETFGDRRTKRQRTRGAQRRQWTKGG